MPINPKYPENTAIKLVFKNIQVSDAANTKFLEQIIVCEQLFSEENVTLEFGSRDYGLATVRCKSGLLRIDCIGEVDVEIIGSIPTKSIYISTDGACNFAETAECVPELKLYINAKKNHFDCHINDAEFIEITYGNANNSSTTIEKSIITKNLILASKSLTLHGYLKAQKALIICALRATSKGRLTIAQSNNPSRKEDSSTNYYRDSFDTLVWQSLLILSKLKESELNFKGATNLQLKLILNNTKLTCDSSVGFTNNSKSHFSFVELFAVSLAIASEAQMSGENVMFKLTKAAQIDGVVRIDNSHMSASNINVSHDAVLDGKSKLSVVYQEDFSVAGKVTSANTTLQGQYVVALFGGIIEGENVLYMQGVISATLFGGCIIGGKVFNRTAFNINLFGVVSGWYSSIDSLTSLEFGNLYIPYVKNLPANRQELYSYVCCNLRRMTSSNPRDFYNYLANSVPKTADQLWQTVASRAGIIRAVLSTASIQAASIFTFSYQAVNLFMQMVRMHNLYEWSSFKSFKSYNEVILLLLDLKGLAISGNALKSNANNTFAQFTRPATKGRETFSKAANDLISAALPASQIDTGIDVSASIVVSNVDSRQNGVSVHPSGLTLARNQFEQTMFSQYDASRRYAKSLILEAGGTRHQLGRATTEHISASADNMRVAKGAQIKVTRSTDIRVKKDFTSDGDTNFANGRVVAGENIEFTEASTSTNSNMQYESQNHNDAGQSEYNQGLDIKAKKFSSATTSKLQSNGENSQYSVDANEAVLGGNEQHQNASYSSDNMHVAKGAKIKVTRSTDIRTKSDFTSEGDTSFANGSVVAGGNISFTKDSSSINSNMRYESKNYNFASHGEHNHSKDSVIVAQNVIEFAPGAQVHLERTLVSAKTVLQQANLRTTDTVVVAEDEIIRDDGAWDYDGKLHLEATHFSSSKSDKLSGSDSSSFSAHGKTAKLDGTEKHKSMMYMIDQMPSVEARDLALGINKYSKITPTDYAIAITEDTTDVQFVGVRNDGKFFIFRSKGSVTIPPGVFRHAPNGMSFVDYATARQFVETPGFLFETLSAPQDSQWLKTLDTLTKGGAAIGSAGLPYVLTPAGAVAVVAGYATALVSGAVSAHKRRRQEKRYEKEQTKRANAQRDVELSMLAMAERTEQVELLQQEHFNGIEALNARWQHVGAPEGITEVEPMGMQVQQEEITKYYTVQQQQLERQHDKVISDIKINSAKRREQINKQADIKVGIGVSSNFGATGVNNNIYVAPSIYGRTGQVNVPVYNYDKSRTVVATQHRSDKATAANSPVIRDIPRRNNTNVEILPEETIYEVRPQQDNGRTELFSGQLTNMPTLANILDDTGYLAQPGFVSGPLYYDDQDQSFQDGLNTEDRMPQQLRSQSYPYSPNVVSGQFEISPFTPSFNNSRGNRPKLTAANINQMGYTDPMELVEDLLAAQQKKGPLEESPVNSALIGAGRAFVQTGQGATQFAMQVGEKVGLVDGSTLDAYNDKITREHDLYRSTPVGNSLSGDFGEFAGEMLLFSVIPGGAAARGGKLALWGATSGAVITGLQPVYHGDLTQRGINTLVGAASGAVITPAVAKAFDLGGTAIVKLYKRKVSINRGKWIDSAPTSTNLSKLTIELEQRTLHSIFNKDGTLTRAAIDEAVEIQLVSRYRITTPVRMELSMRGNIEDWIKARTQKFHTGFNSIDVNKSKLSQTAEVHFYKNVVTGEVYYGCDYKIKLDAPSNPQMPVSEFIEILPKSWRPVL